MRTLNTSCYVDAMAIVIVKDVVPHLNELQFVGSNATLDVVRSKMVLNYISRVPVIDGEGRTLRGIVRMKSLFRRGVAGNEPLELRDVLEKSPPVVNADTSLFEAIKTLDQAKEVLVRERDGGKYTHILTPRGLANWLIAYAKPFLVVEELETALRDAFRPFEGERLAALVGETAVEKLAPRDYEKLSTELHAEVPALSTLDPAVIRSVLVRFAERRNQLMHFRLENKPSLGPDLERFANLRAWLTETRRTP